MCRVRVRRVIEPPEQGGGFDLGIEPGGLVVITARTTKQARIRLVEEFFQITLIPAVLYPCERNEEPALAGIGRFQVEANTTSEKSECPICEFRAIRILANLRAALR
jgi:hypothetical protein